MTMIATAAVATVVMTAGTASAATTLEKVYESDLGDGWHTGDTREGATVEFTDEYGSARGSGAAVFDTSVSASQKVQLLTDEWAGTELADITALSYATFQDLESSGQVALPALNIQVDLDNDPEADAFLVFEPYQDQGNAAIQSGVWQSWDALRGGEAKWWLSHRSNDPSCGQAAVCSWSRILDLYSGATIVEDPTTLRGGSTAVAELHGSIGINQGTGNAGLVAAADVLRIATAGRDVTYDFEPAVILSGKGDCKNGDWVDSTSPTFRNQGECVSHFARK